MCALAVGTLAGTVACTGEPTPPASGDPAGTSLVIAVAEEPVSLNPLVGYAGHGAAKIFDGLLEHRADSSLRPALAADLPVPSPDGRSWTVSLRPEVTFSDGTPFDANDVVATYRALLDPTYASPVRQRFSMLTGVQALSPTTVRFDLSRPYAPFPELLVLGVLPNEALATPADVAKSPQPVGTGPYRLADWRPGERMVLEANPSYFDGRPAIKTVTVEFLPDDDARAARMRDGKLDGAALPPTLARAFEGSGGLRVVAHSAADVHAITLPTGDPVTADAALRLALNYAVNRQVLVDTVLAGKGTQASTPVPDVLAEFVEPTARYPHDVTKALDTMVEGSWLPGPDGVRAKGGLTARFTVRYAGGDTVARELAQSFAADAKAIGVQVDIEAVSRSAVADQAGDVPMMLSSGNPFDPDLDLFALLHSAAANPAGYANATVDASLEVGRTATDPAQRAAAYRKLQRAYLGAPGMVALAAPNHTYVIRESWNGYQPVIDADTADATWGAWWNLQKWTPR